MSRLVLDWEVALTHPATGQTEQNSPVFGVSVWLAPLDDHLFLSLQRRLFRAFHLHGASGSLFLYNLRAVYLQSQISVIDRVAAEVVDRTSLPLYSLKLGKELADPKRRNNAVEIDLGVKLSLRYLNLLVKQLLTLVPFPALGTLSVPLFPTAENLAAEYFEGQAATVKLLKRLSTVEFNAKLIVPVVLERIITAVLRPCTLKVVRLQRISVVGERLVGSQDKTKDRKERDRLASNFSDYECERTFIPEDLLDELALAQLKSKVAEFVSVIYFFSAAKSSGRLGKLITYQVVLWASCAKGCLDQGRKRQLHVPSVVVEVVGVALNGCSPIVDPLRDHRIRRSPEREVRIRFFASISEFLGRAAVLGHQLAFEDQAGCGLVKALIFDALAVVVVLVVGQQ